MSGQVTKAKRFVRGRRFLTAAILTIVVVGLGVFAGSGFVAKASTSTTTLDSCGYNPAAAPKPGGGTVIFDENTVTRTIAVYGIGFGAHVGVFANDESSLFVGTGGQAFKSAGTMTLAGTLTLNSTYTSISVSSNPALASGDSIVLKNASGTQTVKTSGAVAASSGSNTIPVVSFKAGKTFNPGDSATDTNASLGYGSASPAALGTGTDVVGRFQAPSLYITDITSGFSNAGDYEQGGTRVSPFTADGLYGGWSNVIGSPPAVKNNWNLGPKADTPPAGTTSFNEGYGTEVVWNVSNLSAGGQPLQAGHTYRVQSITHDDDQNHTSGGGDTGEVCTTIGIPGISTVATGQTHINADSTATISDTVTVGGVSTPLPASGANKITVTAYSPGDTTCTGTPAGGPKDIALNTSTPNRNDYSASFSVTHTGDYHFTADLYLGGVKAASSTCGAANETATVGDRPTTLTTDAGGPYSPSTSLSDVATLTGGTTVAGGTLTFTLYADNAGACGAVLGTATKSVTNANGATYTGTVTSSPAGTYFGAGTYHWSVSYSGDNDPVSGVTRNEASSDGVNPCPAVDSDTPLNHENPVINQPAISVDKSPNTQTIESAGNTELTVAGGNPTPGTATFNITVTNSGNTDLTNVKVTDAQAPDCNRDGSDANHPLVGNLAKGAKYPSTAPPGYSCTATGLTANMHNIAIAEGDGGAQHVSANDDANVTVIHPHIQVTKTPANQSVPLGGTAHFTITVTNDGDVTLTNVLVTDALAPGCARTDPTAANYPAGLASMPASGAGHIVTYTCDSDPVQAPFTNVVGTCGTDQLGNTVCDNDHNNGNPSPDCTANGGYSGDQCAGVGIDSMASAQDFKPKDTATVSVTGPHNALNGKVLFSLYKGSCTAAHLIYQDKEPVDAGGVAFTASVDYLSTLLANANSAYNAGLSPAEIASTAGTYNWQLSYGEDTNGNADLHGSCGTENFVVTNG